MSRKKAGKSKRLDTAWRDGFEAGKASGGGQVRKVAGAAQVTKAATRPAAPAQPALTKAQREELVEDLAYDSYLAALAANPNSALRRNAAAVLAKRERDEHHLITASDWRVHYGLRGGGLWPR